MTQRLWYTDSYTTEFTGEVTAARVRAPGQLEVELAATYFYPESGGQLSDRGTLGGMPVVDVVDGGSAVVHVLAGTTPPRVGERLAGSIDAQRRREHRQQHTGQHVLSRMLEARLSLATLSSRLGESGNTIDVPGAAVDLAQLEGVEDECNALLWRGLPVTVSLLTPAEAEVAGLRKAVDRSGPIRVIAVADFDRSACGGTHVANTAEIGLVAITAVERMRGNARIHFLCGDRALRYRRQRDRLVAQAAQALTTGEDGLLAAVQRLQDEGKAATRRASALARELFAARTAGWLAEAETLTLGGATVRLLARPLPPEFAELAAEAAATLARQPDLLVAFAVGDGVRTQCVLARGSAVPADCRELLTAALAPVGGKGGGSAERARGSAPPPVSGDVAQQMLERVRLALQPNR